MRHLRTALWIVAMASLLAGLFLVEWEDRVGGTFEVRPIVRAELRAPLAGFLEQAYFDEGDRVSPGTLVARLAVPELASQIQQKRAELRESAANLRLLETGPRPEDIFHQRQRVERARSWRDLAQRELAQAKLALTAELARMKALEAQHRAELEFAEDALQRQEKTLARKATSQAEYLEAKKNVLVVQAQLAQARADRQARAALGNLLVEAKLARAEKELAEAESTLALMEAGTRPEEIDAARAQLARLEEELRYLEGLQQRRLVHSPDAGVLVTPHVKEKVGQYFEEGDLICQIDEPAVLQAEIVLAEQDVARIEPGDKVHLKVRALPYETFPATVERIAPSAAGGDVQSTVIVYCRLKNPDGRLRPGMSGHARIYVGRRSIGQTAVDRVHRIVRTEFWW